MKKQLQLILITLLLPLAAFADTWQDPETKVNYEYTVGTGEASVTSSEDVSGQVTILSMFTVDGNTYKVTSIGNSAFRVRRDLTSITIPNSVTSIGYQAFYYCIRLADVYVFATQKISTGSYLFERVTLSSAILHVPVSSLGFYQSNSPWKEFGMIVPIEDGEDMEDDLQYYLNSLNDTEDTYANNVYKRVFRNDDWQTLYVPFAMDYDEWANRFEVAAIDGFALSDDNANAINDHFVMKATVIESGST